MKQEIEMLIRKEVVTLKESLFKTFQSKQNKLQMETDTLKSSQKLWTKDPYWKHNMQQTKRSKKNNEIKLSLKSIAEAQETIC